MEIASPLRPPNSERKPLNSTKSLQNNEEKHEKPGSTKKMVKVVRPKKSIFHDVDMYEPTIPQQVCSIVSFILFALVIQEIVFKSSSKIICSFDKPISNVAWFKGWLVYFYVMACFSAIFILMIVFKFVNNMRSINKLIATTARVFCIVWNIVGIYGYFNNDEYACVTFDKGISIRNIENLTLCFIVFALIGLVFIICYTAMLCCGLCIMCAFGPEVVL